MTTIENNLNLSDAIPTQVSDTLVLNPTILPDIKKSTQLVLQRVESTVKCNRYNRKKLAYGIIGDMMQFNNKRRVIVARLMCELGVNSNYANVLIQQYRTLNGLVESRADYV